MLVSNFRLIVMTHRVPAAFVTWLLRTYGTAGSYKCLVSFL
jgi:hypothetical protein